MLLIVLAGLILWNAFALRPKMGGSITFLAITLALTAYSSVPAPEPSGH